MDKSSYLVPDFEVVSQMRLAMELKARYGELVAEEFVDFTLDGKIPSQAAPMLEYLGGRPDEMSQLWYQELLKVSNG